MTGADFSAVRTMETVERLIDEGRLITLLLLPERFGGEAQGANCVYVPPHVLAAQDRYFDGVEELVRSGAVVELFATPEYRGQSLVPTRIAYQATQRGNTGPVTFLQIW